MTESSACPWTLCVVGYFLAEAVRGWQVEIRGERWAEVGGEAVLRCEHPLPPDQVHKVEWFAGSRKVFQFVRGRSPPYRNFSLAGALIDWQLSDEHQLALRELEFDASGLYSCQVSTNHPIYTKPSDTQELTIIKRQQEEPEISVRRGAWAVGEILRANCSSAPARPVPDVTWLLNGTQVAEGLALAGAGPLAGTAKSELAVRLESAGPLELTCLATIPAFTHRRRHAHYADHRRSTIIVDVVEETPEPVASASLAARCPVPVNYSGSLFLSAVVLLIAFHA